MHKKTTLYLYNVASLFYYLLLTPLVNTSGSAHTREQRGDSVPSVDYAKRIADALGVFLDYLVSDSDKEDILDNDAVNRIKEIGLT